MATRSDSLRRSSAASRIVVSPSAKQAASATSGSSSIASGISAPPTSVPRSGASADADRADRLAAALAHRLDLDLGAHPLEDRRAGRSGSGCVPTPSRVTSLPGTSSAATMKKAAEEKSAGTANSPGSSRFGRPQRDAAAQPGDVGAGGGEHALGVVAAAAAAPDPGLALGEQAGEEQARLDLGARDRQLVARCRVSGGALDLERRQAVLAAAQLGAHRPQRLGDAVDRPAPDRVVAVEGPGAAGLPRQPAGQQAQQGAGVADVDRRRARRRAGRRRGCRSIGSIAVASAPSTVGAERLDRGQGRAGVGGVEVALDRGLALRPSPRSAPRGGRSTCRPAGAGRRAAGRSGRSGCGMAHSPSATALTVWPSSRTSADRARGLIVAGDPEGDGAGGHVGRRVERHVLDVDAGLAEGEGELGDRSGPVGDDDPQLAQRAAAELGLEQPAPVRAGARVPRGDRLALAARGSARRPRAGGRATASTASATASLLLAKMSPQIAGLAPATRVVSRKLGPTSGIRSESRVSSAAASADEDVGDDVRQVADRRHQAVVGLGVDRLRPRAEPGDVRCRRS